MDDLAVTGILLLFFLFIFLGAGLWIAMTLVAVGIVALELATSAPIGRVLASSMWSKSINWTLTALPLFIWMGEILFRTRLSEDMFRGLAPWLERFPGRLLHVNIVGCAIFAAVSGSSAATAATVGKMALPELDTRGYDERMAIGTLGGAATLGLLIPPSIMLIVYGVAADVSIARLFIAGVIPGAILALMFMGYVAIWALLFPKKVPPAASVASAKDLFVGLLRLLPVVGLIVAIIGSIYAGLATATEAAAVGVVGALTLSFLTGSLTKDSFKRSLIGATVTSCMITLILAAAGFLTVAMGFVGIPRELASWVTAMELSPYLLILALTLLFVILGCFLDGVSIVVLTTSVILPVVSEAGISLLWFGIYLVIVVEMSQITPPVGFNLFVIQSMTGRDIFFIARACLPFFLMLGSSIVLFLMFPELVTYLPEEMMRR